MKRLLIAAALIAAVGLSGCADNKNIEGQTYQPYGIINKDTIASPNVNYEISGGSVIAAVIFSETVVVPIYVVGWDLWEPVCVKPAPGRTDCNLVK
jgi:hypothetical protein